jgi:oligosaccharide repeat unit polymerase
MVFFLRLLHDTPRGEVCILDSKNVKIWWLNPATIFFIIMSFVFLGVFLVSDRNYQIYYNTNKYVDSETIWYSILATISFIVGIVVTIILLNRLEVSTTFYREIKQGNRLYRKIIYLLFFFTLFGYFAWAFMLYRNGAPISLFLDVLSGEENAIYILKHQYLTKVAGITSFTNFGIPFIILATYYNFYNKRKLISRLMVIVFVLSILRAIFFAERLAILELLIPATVIYVLLKLKSGKPPKYYRLYPVFGFLFVFLLFAAGEYFRSWANYYQFVYPSYYDFITTRFFGYYVTALNTGTLYVSNLNVLPFPYFTLEWFWKFPLIGEDSYLNLWHVSPSDLIQNMLYTRGNPEFNNSTGLLLPYLDYGVFGGSVFWVVLGILTGLLYLFFMKGYLLGALLYPAWILGITEIPRYLYFVSGRFFPTWMTIVFLALFIAYLRKMTYATIKYRKRSFNAF